MMRLLGYLILPCVLVIGCGRGQRAGQEGPPPPVVSVSHPVARDVTDWDEYTGRLVAVDAVELRARVNGYVQDAPYAEGAIVERGQLLFVIDERPYKAELERAQGALADAQARQHYASAEFARIEPLRKEGAVSEQEFLQSRQALEGANAAVQSQQAAVESARLNLEWCRVTAPVAGRAGRKLVTPGNLVSGGSAVGGQSTLLTTITSVDPMYCYVDVDERSVRRYQRLIREGSRPSARTSRLPAQLALTDENEFQHAGYIDFVDNQINPNTGTISVRGVFPNQDRQLLPGFFARLRIPGRGPYHALLVPDEAIGTNLAQRFVLVVDDQDVVQLLPVAPGTIHDGLRAVEGINPNDRVIVNGAINVRAGMKVRPQETPIRAPTTREASPYDAMPATLPAAATMPTSAPATAPATSPVSGGVRQ
jgi:multidrug efflux system membrane fusion protein